MPFLTNEFDSFGLDIGDRSIKAAHIKKRANGFALKTFGSAQVPEEVLNRGVIANPNELGRIILSLLKSTAPRPITTKYVHACLPETHTFIKLLTVEKKEEHELAAHIREILPNHIPLEPDESYIDWKIIDSDADAGGKVQVLVGAVPKKTADAYNDLLIKIGLIPVSLQIEAEAILRALNCRKKQTFDKPHVIIDVGATRSSFILTDKAVIQFTVSLPTAGVEITRIIAQKLELTYEKAEKAKKMFGLDAKKCDGSIKKILMREISSLADSIQKNILFYVEHFQGARPASNIILCGGGANLAKFTDTLEELLPHKKILLANPLANIMDGQNMGQDIALSYTTAIGLALTGAL